MFLKPYMHASRMVHDKSWHVSSAWPRYFVEDLEILYIVILFTAQSNGKKIVLCCHITTGTHATSDDE
jgi:hypothetical protein